jgi:5'-methylthioadenosine phosphorylase
MAHVTDYDVWHLGEAPVSVDAVIEVMNRNTHIAREALVNLTRDLQTERKCDCASALATALITDPKVVSPETRQRLNLLIDKYLG